MGATTQAATEASAAAAMAVAIAFVFTGAYIPAAVAALIGVGLFIVYEKLGYDGIELSEEQIEAAAEEADARIEELRER